MEERRSTDPNIVELATSFKNFVERYERDQAAAKDWRHLFDTDMKGVQTLIAKLMIPYRLAGWIITITGGAFFIELIKRAFDFVKDHIK